MALRLSRLFGNSPEFWLNAQRAVDLGRRGKNWGKVWSGDTRFRANPTSQQSYIGGVGSVSGCKH